MGKVKYTKVLKCDDLEIGKSAIIEVGDKEIALFNYKGEYYAIDAVCTHRGGNLSEGDLDGDCIVCPLHGARFDIRTGVKERGNPDQNVATYPIRVDGNAILLGIDSDEPNGGSVYVI